MSASTTEDRKSDSPCTTAQAMRARVRIEADTLARDLDMRVEGTAEGVRSLQGQEVAGQFKVQMASVVRNFRGEAQKIDAMPETDLGMFMERLRVSRIDIISSMDSARGTLPEMWVWPDPSRPRISHNMRALLDIRSAIVEIRSDISALGVIMRQMTDMVTSVKQQVSELVAQRVEPQK